MFYCAVAGHWKPVFWMHLFEPCNRELTVCDDELEQELRRAKARKHSIGRDQPDYITLNPVEYGPLAAARTPSPFWCSLIPAEITRLQGYAETYPGRCCDLGQRPFKHPCVSGEQCLQTITRSAHMLWADQLDADMPMPRWMCGTECLASLGFKVVPNVPGEDLIGEGLTWSDVPRCSFNIPAPWRNPWTCRAQAGNSMDTEEIFRVLLFTFTHVTINDRAIERVQKPLFTSKFLAHFLTPDDAKRETVRRRMSSKTTFRK